MAQNYRFRTCQRTPSPVSLCFALPLHTIVFLWKQQKVGRLPRQARDEHTNGTGSGHTLKEKRRYVCVFYMSMCSGAQYDRRPLDGTMEIDRLANLAWPGT